MLSTLLLIVLSPLLVMIMCAVKMSSRGFYFYRSIRPGLGGKQFACLKFRTMLTDAERRQGELEGTMKLQVRSSKSARTRG